MASIDSPSTVPPSTSTPVEPLRCPSCGRQCKTNAGLAAHRRSHKTESSQPRNQTNCRAIETKITDIIDKTIKLAEPKINELLSLQNSTAIIFDRPAPVGKAIRNALTAETNGNWDKMLLLKAVLATCPPHRRWEKIRRRLRAFEEGDVAWLMEDARKVLVSLSSMHSTREQKLSRSRKAARAAVAAGHPGKALRKLAHCDTAPPTDDTLSAFQALHPQGRDLPHPPNDLPALPSLSGPVV